MDKVTVGVRSTILNNHLCTEDIHEQYWAYRKRTGTPLQQQTALYVTRTEYDEEKISIDFLLIHI